MRSALEAGKHVLVEKPLTPSVVEGEKLAALANRSGLGAHVRPHVLLHPGRTRIRELIHGGEIGDVQFIDSVRINLGLVQPDVNVLWDLAPHDLSILDFVLPADVAPVAVAAHVADPIGAGRACLAYLIGVAIQRCPRSHSRELAEPDQDPDDGIRRLTPHHRLGRHQPGRTAGRPRPWRGQAEGWDLPQDERRQALISYRTGDTLVPALPEREALMSVMVEFSAAISEDRPPLTDAEAGLRVLGIAGGGVAERGQRWRADIPDGNRLRDRRSALPCDGRCRHHRVDNRRSACGRRRRRDRGTRQLRPRQAGEPPRGAGSGKVRVVDGDIRDRDLVRSLMPGIDVVFHQAAIRITQCATEPRLALEVLVDGTYEVVEAAADAGIRKVVAASSASVYGLAEEFPTPERQHPYANDTLYGAAKTFNEGLLRQLPRDAWPGLRDAPLLQRVRAADGHLRPVHRGADPVDGADRGRASRRSSSATACRPWTLSSPRTSRALTCSLRRVTRPMRSSTSAAAPRPASWSSPRRSSGPWDRPAARIRAAPRLSTLSAAAWRTSPVPASAWAGNRK